MRDKYEDNFWGQIDILHQKTKRQQISFNYLMDMLSKFQDGCLNFSKNLQSVLSKRHEIIEYHSMTIYDVSENMSKLMKISIINLKMLIIV